MPKNTQTLKRHENSSKEVSNHPAPRYSPGEMNINKLMKQMQDMQSGMAKTQEELANQTVTASVGGDKVKVTATGTGDITAIEIDPAVIDPEDAEFLQDLILSGVQQALSEGKDLAAKKMGKLTGGMNIPGLG